MKPTLAYVSRAVFEQAAACYSADLLQENGQVRGLVQYNGDIFVTIGVHTGHQVSLVQAVNPAQWQPPLGTSDEHYYAGQVFTYEGERWVLTRRRLEMVAPNTKGFS